MVKAARAFSEAGYGVRVVSTTLMDHFREMDNALVAREQWEWDPLEWAADREWLTYARTRVRHNAARHATAVIGSRRAPFAMAPPPSIACIAKFATAQRVSRQTCTTVAEEARRRR